MSSSQDAADRVALQAAEDSRLTRLGALLVRNRSLPERLAWLVAAVAAATLARAAAGLLTTGVPLVFYLPAVVVVSLFTGWECGVIAVVLSTLCAWFLFVPPVFAFHIPTGPQTLTLLFWGIVAASQIAIAQFLRLALRRVLHSETRYRRLLSVASEILWIGNDRAEIHLPQPGWTELTGIAWPEYRGRGWLKAIHPEDQPQLAFGSAQDEAFREAELRLWHADHGDWRWFQVRSVAVPAIDGKGREWITSLHDIHDRRLASDRRDLVIGELRHRLKNLFTVIEALANSSRDKSDPDLDRFLSRFLGRLRAIAAAGDLALAGRHSTIECGAVVRATLEPFMGNRSSRIQISGPEVVLSEQTGGTLALAVHEMATNALKYGALSVENGSVFVHWSIKRLGDEEEQVCFEWKERGGPPPKAQNKDGFGTRLIRSVAAQERNGEVAIDYQPEGFSCRIAFLRSAQGGPRIEPLSEAAQ